MREVIVCLCCPLMPRIQEKETKALAYYSEVYTVENDTILS